MASVVCSNSTSQSFVFDISQYLYLYSLSLSSYTVKPEKQTINCNGHFIAQLADQCTPIMGVLFASGVLPVSFQGPCLSILCGARHSCYVYCFLNRLVHYDALHRTLYVCVFQ